MRFFLIFSMIWLSSRSDTPRLLLSERNPRATSSSLSQVADHLSVIARLVNGIALQNELSTNLTGFNDFIAELLDVELGDAVEQLLSFSIDAQTINGQLDKIHNDVTGLAKNPISNAAQVKDGISSLMTMKEKLADLESGAEADNMQSLADNLRKIARVKILLNDLQNYTVINGTLEALKKLAKPVAHSSPYELAKHGEPRSTSSIHTIVEVAEKYKSEEVVLSSLPSQVMLLNQEYSLLLPIIQKHSEFSLTSLSLSSVLPHLKVLGSPRTSSRQLTMGLPNGAKDMKQLMKELKEDWLKNKLADGKDIGRLTRGMFLIERIAGKVEDMERSSQAFRTVSNVSGIADIVASLLKSLAVDGEKLSNGSSKSLQASIASIAKSVTNLKPLNTPVDLKSFRIVYDFARNFHDQFVSMEAAIKEVIKKITDDQIKVFGNIAGLCVDVHKDANRTQLERAVEAIQNVTKFQELVSTMDLVVSKLAHYPNAVKLADYGKGLNWTVVQGAQSALKGTGLVETLHALQDQNYDSAAVDEVLQFGITARKVQTARADIDSIKVSLDSIVKTKNAVEVVKKEVSSWSGSSRRRRDASDAEALKKLDRSRELALSIGRGTNLLRNLALAYERKGDLVAAADSGDEVNKVISGVPSMQDVWTDANRKALKRMVNQLEELEKFGVENKDKELMVIGSIFEKAGGLSGVAIPSNSIRNDVLPAMQASTDQKVTAAIPTFTSVSSLELDYSKHSIHLHGTLVSLEAVQKFFDEMFDVKRTNTNVNTVVVVQEKSQAPPKNHLKVFLITIVAVFVSVAFIGILVWFLLRWKKNRDYQKLLSDPDQWILMAFTNENEYYHYHKPFATIANDDFGSLKSSISNGFYIDTFDVVQGTNKRNTLLHETVLHNRPEMAKYLIENGADLWLKNHDYETPLMMAKRLKKKNLVALLKKYEAKKKSYRKVLPGLLTKGKYKIGIHSVAEVAGHRQFSAKFAENIVSKYSDECTHLVVNVDKEGYFEVEKSNVDVIFGPAMLMSHQWLSACVKNPDNLMNNRKWRVKGLKFQGEKFESLLRIKDSFNRRKIGALYGGHVFLTDTYAWRNYDFISRRLQAKCMGFIDPPTPEHLYYREDIPKHIVVWSNEADKLLAAEYENQPESVVVMHQNEFIRFLLEFNFGEEHSDRKENKGKGEKKGKKGTKGSKDKKDKKGKKGAKGSKDKKGNKKKSKDTTSQSGTSAISKASTTKSMSKSSASTIN